MNRLAIVGTDEFWRLSCQPAFYRASFHCGVIGSQGYFTFDPPGTEYLLRVIESIARDLGLDRPHPIGDFMWSIAIQLMWSVLCGIYATFLWWLWF